jgi:succinate-semialdehyde dehydrogenase/glutarate-semialdehyde dehydrogenase
VKLPVRGKPWEVSYVTGRRGRTAANRCALLRRWFELMLENREDLAVLMIAEQGKPVRRAVEEIQK